MIVNIDARNIVGEFSGRSFIPADPVSEMDLHNDVLHRGGLPFHHRK